MVSNDKSVPPKYWQTLKEKMKAGQFLDGDIERTIGARPNTISRWRTRIPADIEKAKAAGIAAGMTEQEALEFQNEIVEEYKLRHPTAFAAGQKQFERQSRYKALFLDPEPITGIHRQKVLDALREEYLAVFHKARETGNPASPEYLTRELMEVAGLSISDVSRLTGKDIRNISNAINIKHPSGPIFTHRRPATSTEWIPFANVLHLEEVGLRNDYLKLIIELRERESGGKVRLLDVIKDLPENKSIDNILLVLLQKNIGPDKEFRSIQHITNKAQELFLQRFPGAKMPLDYHLRIGKKQFATNDRILSAYADALQMPEIEKESLRELGFRHRGDKKMLDEIVSDLGSDRTGVLSRIVKALGLDPSEIYNQVMVMPHSRTKRLEKFKRWDAGEKMKPEEIEKLMYELFANETLENRKRYETILAPLLAVSNEIEKPGIAFR